MRKHLYLAVAITALLSLAGLAIAGTVYDRSSGTTAVATGIATITPEAKYAGVVLKKAWVEAAAATNVVATIYRVVSSGAYTQSVATVSCTTLTRGSGVPAQYAAVKAGEYFYVTTNIGAAGTNAVVLLDYEVQTHD